MFIQANNLCFSHARVALKWGLRELGLKSGDVVLVPEYNCDVVLQPLSQLDLRYRFYGVDEQFRPNLRSLQELSTVRARALLMVHYSGQAQKHRTVSALL